MSPASVKIRLYDLQSAARTGKLQDVVARNAELTRLVRILLRPHSHHALIIGEPGSGKTSLIEALAYRAHQGTAGPVPRQMYRLRTEAIQRLIVSGDSLAACMDALEQAVAQLDQAIIVVEDLQLLTADDPIRIELVLQLLTTLMTRPGIRLIATVSAGSYHQTLRDNYLIGRLFSPLELSPPSSANLEAMLEHHRPRLEQLHRQTIEPTAITTAIELGGRFGHGRALPDAALRLLEESAVMAALEARSTLSHQDVATVVAEREHIPLGDLTEDDEEGLLQLENHLQQAVIGQPSAISLIAANIARARLGLTDPARPRGSFLLLGPSGVGKTETAKALARLIYKHPRALVRLDMSEYSEAHAAVRLIGSPPGYVGYEEGGQLTGAVAREPYSLILLDEIEKAHAKLFDLFLQLLDDGRLTDSSGQVVDFAQTMVIATSNSASADIAQAAHAGVDVQGHDFMQSVIMPRLLQAFRPEFINRFDAVLVYQPLTERHLLALTQRELRRLEARLQGHGIRFDIPEEHLLQLLRPLINPLFGARPVKRLVAQYFETPVANRLLRRQLTGPLTLNGTEPWLNP